jgi:hypothetical protein
VVSVTAATWTAAELGRTRMIVLKSGKAPAQRGYAPRSTDPGQRVTWTRGLGYGQSETRTGTVWSAGALSSSVWVQPDDAPAGDCALVMLRSMLEHCAYPPSWQHDTIARCEHLRQSKGLFAEVRWLNRYFYPCEPGTPGAHEDVVAYHCDRDCLEIRHETRDCTSWEPTLSSVIGMLLSAQARGRSDLCRRCVYRTEPGLAEDGAL